MSTYNSLKSGTDMRAVAMGDKALLTPQLAERIGAPGAARAVGHALGANPIAVVVPFVDGLAR